MESDFSPRPSRRKQWIVGLIVASAGLFWVVQTFRKGALTADPGSVTMVIVSRPSDGARNVAPDGVIFAGLNPDHALDPGTLDGGSVRLVRADNRAPVPAQVSTSAAGDQLVLTPLRTLDPSTKYTFEVDGVKDAAGADLLPFTMSFTTSAADGKAGAEANLKPQTPSTNGK
jgi:hypothetical protein